MLIQIDPKSDLAIYEQIIRQVKFGIASGVVKSNELIPSVRELSKQLAINPNTVARAYRSLQRERILYARRGLGLAVAEEARERCRRERIGMIRDRIHQVLQEARRSRLQVEEIRELLEKELALLTSMTEAEAKKPSEYSKNHIQNMERSGEDE